MEIKRKKTRTINIGDLKIGGSNPVSVQSMVKTGIEDPGRLRKEISELAGNGCELIRMAVPEKQSVAFLKQLISEGIFTVPVVADIHFDYKLALACIDAGVDGVRINPGNIGSLERTGKVIEEAKKKNTAVRIGVNSGSINKKILKKNKGNIVNAMVESTVENVRLLERLEFYNFKVSAKASSVLDTINIYESISARIDYPLHLGVTEAGPLFRGSIKSSLGLGILLAKGIGDTIRVSLTERSVKEVKAAYIILNSLGLRDRGVDIISCPTCGRTKGDLKSIVEYVEKLTTDVKKNFKLAVMGCIVNGPGEAKEADLGIAFGKDKAAVFLKGSIIKRVPKNKVKVEFEKELEKLIKRN
jgi:(E)-4-hydroxy-3-methylbut-2-enyl-diphosphate synthase